MRKTFLIVASFAESLINFRYQLIQALLRHDYHVVVCAPKDEAVEAMLAKLGVIYLPIQLSRTGYNPFADLRAMFKLGVIFCKTKPDIILSYTHKPVVYASIAGKIVGVKNIYSMITGMGYAFSNSGLKSNIIGFITKCLLKFALKLNQKVFFQNIDNLQFFLSKKILTDKKRAVLINGSGIDTVFFSPAAFPSTLSFLLIARLLIDKGIREYIAAARIIKQRYPNIIFKLVGWIDSNPNSITIDELQSWKNEGLIEYSQKIADVRPTIAASSVYVLPSYCEGVPHTVLEAMAMSRPIITTNAPGCKETVINGLNGFLVPVKNIPQLVDSMHYFILNSDLCETMGKKSREIAIEKFDVHKVNQVMLDAMNIGNHMDIQKSFL